MMEKRTWRFYRLGILVLLFSLLLQSVDLCLSLNTEGLALLRLKQKVVNDPFGALSNWRYSEEEIDHCSWFGVECSTGKVVVLNLKDLCLEGTLPLELKNLVHIKSIILRNNSFEGTIPKGFGELMDLEVLDLGFNNFSGPPPGDLDSNLSLAILLLDNNELLGGLSPEIYELQILSKSQVDKKMLSNAVKEMSSDDKRLIEQKLAQSKYIVHRKLLQDPSTSRMQFWDPYTPFLPPQASPSQASTTVESPSPFPSASADPTITPTAKKTSPPPNVSTSPPSTNHAFALSPTKFTTGEAKSSSSHKKSSNIMGIHRRWAAICLFTHWRLSLQNQ
jgi:hypothetical protein